MRQTDIIPPLFQILTDYQWSLVSGPNTGTDLHIDPLFAQSWNTLVQVMIMEMLNDDD